MNSREMFETCMQKEHPAMLSCSRWHEDEQRYTTMSTTQLLWNVWKACCAQQSERIKELETAYESANTRATIWQKNYQDLRQRIADAPVVAHITEDGKVFNNGFVRDTDKPLISKEDLK